MKKIREERGLFLGCTRISNILLFKSKIRSISRKFWTRKKMLTFLSGKEENQGIKENELPLEKIIDLKKWADYFALCDLLYTSHGYVPKSVKFYYNQLMGF